MNTIIDNDIKSCEPLHEFWNKGGFVLCTAGEAEIRINESVYHLKSGSVFIVTPLIQIYEIKASDDFERISFVNELKIFYPIFKQISDTGIPLKISRCPCWNLNDEEYLFVKSQHERIENKINTITSSSSA